MVGLAFAVAASANFPILFLSIYWSKLTTRGAFIGGFLGLITAAVVLVVLSETVWVKILDLKQQFSLINTCIILNSCSIYWYLVLLYYRFI